MSKSDRINLLLTESTKRSFVGPIGSFKLKLNEPIGPFYRLDNGYFVNEFDSNIGKQSLINKKLTVNITHLINLRTSKLNRIMEKNSEEISNLEKSIGKAFIESNFDEIEGDPDFNLLPVFQNIFNNPNVKNEIEKEWETTSSGRWCGRIEPTSFLDAHKKYYLPHLFPDENNVLKEYYLFKFYFNKKNNNYDAEIFFGKTCNGSEIQFKFNNHAVYCIDKIEFIKAFKIKIIEE